MNKRDLNSAPQLTLPLTTSNYSQTSPSADFYSHFHSHKIFCLKFFIHLTSTTSIQVGRKSYWKQWDPNKK